MNHNYFVYNLHKIYVRIPLTNETNKDINILYKELNFKLCKFIEKPHLTYETTNVKNSSTRQGVLSLISF